MRDLLKAGLRRFAFGWFWALVLLALPNCGLEQGGLCPNNECTHLKPGDSPQDSAIMCDIEKYQGPQRRCASAQDMVIGVRLASAAEALVSGQASNVGLDYSSAAEAHCGPGHPEAIDFRGSFPDGYVVCLNCGQVIPVPHADATAVCVAQCQDLVESNGGPKPADSLVFCTANAHPSTHFPSNGCFTNACSTGGVPRDNFADPRRLPEPVAWTDLSAGTSAFGNTLTRMAPTTGATTADFNEGAVSTQSITGNDGYVEFEASENNVSHVVGFSQASGLDNDPSLIDITFAISLNRDNHIYLLDGGTVVTATDVDGKAPDVNGSFGTYAAHDRFRVRVKENVDGTATVSFSKLVGACVPGNPCDEDVFYTHAGSAVYPLRVDASFREQNATLANVSIVRIQ